jgi:hypothetical protein
MCPRDKASCVPGDKQEMQCAERSTLAIFAFSVYGLCEAVYVGPEYGLLAVSLFPS